MSNGSSSTKWIVGCLVAGGVGLLVCGGLVFWGVNSMYQAAREGAMRAQEQMVRQARLVEQASSWSLPDGWTAPAADATDDDLFPGYVGDWERVSVSAESTIPVVSIQREVRSGVYTADGQNIDVYVCRVPADEKEAAFQQARLSANISADSDDGTTHSLFYQTWDRTGDGWLVWNGGWLFVVQASNLETPLTDFLSTWFWEIDAGNASDDTEGATPVPENADTLTTPDSATPSLPRPPPPARRRS